MAASTFPRVHLTREHTSTQAFGPGASEPTLSHANSSRPSWSSGHFPDFPWPGSPRLAHGSPFHGDQFPNPTGLLYGACCRPFYPAPFGSPCGPPIPVRLIPFLAQSLRLVPPVLLIPSLILCLYFTGPPATLWRGPTGSSSFPAPFGGPGTSCSYLLPIACALAAFPRPSWTGRSWASGLPVPRVPLCLFSCVPSLILCLYPTGPRATQWLRPEGPFCGPSDVRG